MTYVVRHIRFIQEANDSAQVATVQVDGELNPTDALTKWLPPGDRARHYAFLMGDQSKANRLWRESSKFRNYKPKLIVPVRATNTWSKIASNAEEKKGALFSRYRP